MSTRLDPRYVADTCSRCDGNGSYYKADGEGEILVDPCPSCLGTGNVKAKQEDVLEENVVYAYEILDATDTTEYNALSDANKDAYKMILMCGIVDLTEGTQSHTKLWNIFGEGTTTRTNLEALL